MRTCRWSKHETNWAQDHEPQLRELLQVKVSSVSFADYIVVIEEDTPHRLLEFLIPSILVKGGGYSTGEVIGAEVVTAYGGEVRAMSLVHGISTTSIVQRIRRAAPVSL